ncbi:MAG TPA: type II secretion system protein GspD [Proteobacteria bacterium]|nr:type II secretion system protein D precursor [bacterium BMS3Abin14]HDL53519.1 type II secretion system protein GspD [Pseudomonadota bacterium]
MKERISRKIPAVILTVILMALPMKALAAPAYKIDFNDVDIRKVIETVSEITGKNFLIDDRVQGRVTVVGPKSLTADEIYQVFLSVLRVKGYAMVPAGKINKIVPAANVATYNMDTEVGTTVKGRKGDQYVTQVIHIRYTSAGDLRNLLAPLIPKSDSISAYGPTNLLIITTTESLLARLVQIISVVDVAGAREESRIIKVKYAPVDDLAGKITQIIQKQSGPAVAPRRSARGIQPAPVTGPAATKIIPDERTNSIIAIGDVQTLDRVEDLIGQLDVAMPAGTGKIHVYYLQNADSDDLSKVLMGIPVEQVSSQTTAAPGKATRAAAPRSGTNKTGVSIISDPATNALVITANPEDYAVLESVIRKLDVPRDQVLVEVLIAEVSMDKTLSMGVEWRAANRFRDGTLGFAGSTFGALDSLVVSFPSTPHGLVVGALGETISFNLGGQVIDVPNLGALISLLRTDSDINILSTPTIVTTDNHEAEIVVAQNVPFQTSTKFDSNNQPIITFDYRDVGLTLRITPQINSQRFVKLDIFTQLEALVSNTISTGLSQVVAPTTLKRKAETSVFVSDGQTVVIGGLIRDNQTRVVSRVPVLGSLPILGALFRKTSTVASKTNLLIFLTPHIISNPKEMQEVSRSRVQQQNLLPSKIMESTGLVKHPADDGENAPGQPGEEGK